MLRTLFITLVTMSPLVAGANEYRGMPAGWPASNVGVPAVPVTAGYAPAPAAGYGLYQANRPGYAAPQAYYAARPVESATTSYYATLPGQAPTYSQVNYTQPVTAYYSPPGYAATPMITAYSPGVAAGMSPVYGISPQPGTMLQPQRSYYGSAGAINFAPPAVPVTYRAYYAPAAGAVTMYRPVTVYQPATGQPVTCLQPVTPAYQTCGTASCAPAGCGSTSGCGSSGCGWGLFSWLCNRCSSSGCGTTTCGTASCAPTGCGQQPYYPVVPMNPVTVVPSTTIPVVPAPITTTPPLIGTPRVPPPPTRIIGPGGAADSPPSLSPGGLPSTTVTPLPGSTYTAPGTTLPGSAFPAPTTPPTTTTPIPSSPYTPVPPGSTPAREYYPPAPSADSRFDSSRFAPPAASNNGSNSTNTLRFSPPANSTPNGVRVVPDPDAPTFKPTNQAPQLLNPQDRSARLTNPWAVVPAVWPTKQQAVARSPQRAPQNNVGGRVIQATRSNASRQLNERTDFTPTSAFVRQKEETVDDSGWASGQ